MPVIFDPFTDSQVAAANGTTTFLDSSGTTAWTPPSRRILSSVGLSIIAISGIGGSVLSFTISNQASSVSLTYSYNPGFGYSYQNFSALTQITFTNLSAPTNGFNFNLTITDSFGSSQTRPLTISGNNAFVALADYNAVNLTSVASISLGITSNRTISTNGSFTDLTSTLACVAHNTQIKIADGTEKAVQDIIRGDLVVDQIGAIHKVARLLKTSFNGFYKPDIVVIPKDFLAVDSPHTLTKLSGWHPILHNRVRKPAKCFSEIKGVEWYNQTKPASEIMEPDTPSTTIYSLYNLQYDHEGFFLANGLTVQTVSPWSELYPLDKDLFFDTAANKPLTSESYHTDTVWDSTMLESL